MTKLLKKLLFFVFVAFPLLVLADKRHQVCSITINSSEEIETFKKYLPSKNFAFIELLPNSSEDKTLNEKENNEHWFEKACQKDIQCDVLVISGHFGGKFFGKHGSLDLRYLEKRACQESCSNVLSQVKEVFLFGCNTLAGKEKDTRTPEEYLQVLLDDGISRFQAESVVASRYSFLNNSFNNTMRLVFSSPDKRVFLYGFHSISPSGQNVQHKLEDYLKKVKEREGSYSEHLSRLDEKSFPNSSWNESLSWTNRSQSLSFRAGDKEYISYKKACNLYARSNDIENLKLVRELLGGEERNFYFSYISDFIRRRKKGFKGLALKMFQELQQDKNIYLHFTNLYENIKSDFYQLPLFKIDYLDFLLEMGWIIPADYNFELRDTVLFLVWQADHEAYNALRSLSPYTADIEISLEDLPEDYFEREYALKILVLFPLTDKRIYNKIVKGLEDENPFTRMRSLEALGRLQVQDEEIIHKIVDRLEDQNFLVQGQALQTLGLKKVQDREIIRKIVEKMEDRHFIVQVDALWALGRLQVQDKEIIHKIAEKLEDQDLPVRAGALWTLEELQVQDEGIIRKIKERLKDEDLYMRQEAERILMEIQASDSEDLD